MEKRLQYIAEDINTLLDKTEIAVDTEADRELMTNTPIARAGGLGRVVYVKATKKSYQYNIDTGEWVALPTSGVEIDAEISSTSENPVQNKVISGALDKKQDTLTTEQLAAVNSGITSEKVIQIETNTTNITLKQDKLTDTQLAAVNSGITSADKTQISTNTNNITSLRSDVTTITTKLNTVEEGAQVNTIKSISLNSTPLTPDANKNVEITIPEVNIDNKTITKDNNGKIQTVAITNGTDIINYEALKKAMTITIEE